MGEDRKAAIRLQIVHSFHLAFNNTTLTSDAGLLEYYELSEPLSFTDLAEQPLCYAGSCKSTRLSQGAKLRRSVFYLLAAYKDTNDADR